MFQSLLFQIRENVFRALTRVHVQAEPVNAADIDAEAAPEAPAPAPAPTPEDVVLLREIRDLLKSSAASNAEVKAAVEKLQQK